MNGLRQQLREFLEGAGGLSSGGIDDRTEMLGLLASSGCFEHDHYEPGHFTASAVVISQDAYRVALIDHRKLRKWLQPGGHVEPVDSTLLEAARREVIEETGLSAEWLVPLAQGLPIDLDIHEIPARKSQPAHRHFDVRFGFSVKAPLPALNGDESAAWVAVDDLGTLTTDESVRRVVRAAQQILAGQSQG